ncbi:MAG: hypothetical protein ACM3QY_05455 [Candidatus Levyibacteriota bacterium]
MLLATESSSDARFAVEAGIGLAAATGSCLEGVFIEDANLVRLARLPFAIETSTLTGTKRAFASEEVERALRVEAARVEELIARSATHARVAWSFQVMRGPLIAAVGAQRAELALIATNPSRLGPAASPSALRPIAVLFDTSVAGWRGIEAASQLARSLRRALLLLIPMTGPIAPEQLAQEAAAWQHREGVAGSVVRIHGDTASMITALRTHRSALLTLPAPELGTLAFDLAQLLIELSCPLMIAR